MKRRDFLVATPSAAFAAAVPFKLVGTAMPESNENGGIDPHPREDPISGLEKSKDYKKEPYKRLVILGESTVHGGPWLRQPDGRYADVLVQLINACQQTPIEYFNKGISANAISPRSPGYEESAKPSALERYHADVIDLKPDLFILAYGLNDMRANMPLQDFHDDMATIIRDVKKACSPVIMLTTIYYMRSWRSFPPYDKGSVPLTMRYNESIRGLAAEFDCILADAWGSEGGADWLIHYDGVHANKVGNLLLGHRLFEALAQHSSCLTNGVFAEERDSDWSKQTIKSRADVGDPFTKTW
jgi:lysophospholipase L1-like esterase